MQFPALSEAILDSLSEGVFTVDHDWRITSFNRAAEEITGLLRKDALGQLCAEVLHSSLCESHCPIKAVMEKQIPVQNQRGFFVDTEGSRIPISVSAAVLCDVEGRVLGGVETFRDLSEIDALRRQLRYRSSVFASMNPAMQKILSLVPVLANNPTSVLIQGETGTGKEVLARAIHNEGLRRSRPFVAINCGALPEHLLESELYGYKKGAFTGADRDKPGRIALARDGTLFLDEIGEISPAMQVRLLRVLQEREFEPLGGLQPEPMRARLIAASHHNLQELVKAGRFREDLFYRLEVVRLEIPPLRLRSEDIPSLVSELLARSNQYIGRDVQGLAPEVMTILQNHDWPGNIRQLANVIERAVVLCGGDRIEIEHLPDDLLEQRKPVSGLASRVRQQSESEAILNALKNNDYNRRKTAAALGMHPTSLYRKIKAWGLLN